MITLLLVIHVFVSLSLIAIVLLQSGKGADLGAAFGAGGSGTVFGPTGGQNLLGKLTVAAAVVFMLTSMALAYLYSQKDTGTMMPAEVKQQQQKAADNAAARQTPATNTKEQAK